VLLALQNNLLLTPHLLPPPTTVEPGGEYGGVLWQKGQRHAFGWHNQLLDPIERRTELSDLLGALTAAGALTDQTWAALLAFEEMV
jgi:hypothetical protein